MCRWFVYSLLFKLTPLTNPVHAAFALSGEPMGGPVAATYGTLKEQYTASQIAAVNVAKRAYQKDYMEYWNTTSSSTGTGRPVDAVIAPLAPFAAARPDMYSYYGTLLNSDTDFFCPGIPLGVKRSRLNV